MPHTNVACQPIFSIQGIKMALAFDFVIGYKGHLSIMAADSFPCGGRPFRYDAGHKVGREDKKGTG
jgi:hypothetical protein